MLSRHRFPVVVLVALSITFSIGASAAIASDSQGANGTLAAMANTLREIGPHVHGAPGSQSVDAEAAVRAGFSTEQIALAREIASAQNDLARMFHRAAV